MSDGLTGRTPEYWRGIGKIAAKMTNDIAEQKRDEALAKGNQELAEVYHDIAIEAFFLGDKL